MGLKNSGHSASDPNDIVTLGQIIRTVTVLTGSESRPVTSSIVIWVGGLTAPVNMQTADIWLAADIVANIPPTIITTALTSMTSGSAFTQTLAVTGSAPIVWAVDSGSLPTGVSLNTSTGVVSGTPSVTGAYSVTISATNDFGTDTQVLSGTVAAMGTAPTITTTSLSAMTESSAFTETLSAIGSTPLTWGISAGTIPAGLSINSSTGVISGTPSTAGAFSFTVEATNAFGSDTQVYSGTVGAASSEDLRSIFADTVPATLTSYNDGAPSTWMIHQFYSSSFGSRPALPAGTAIVAVRYYVAPGSPIIGTSGEVSISRLVGETPPKWYGSTEVGEYKIIPNLATSGALTSTGTLVEGWNTIPLEGGPFAWPDRDLGVIAGIRFANQRYQHNATMDENSFQAVGGDDLNFFLAERITVAGSVQRSFYGMNETPARWYGLDIQIEIP